MPFMYQQNLQNKQYHEGIKILTEIVKPSILKFIPQWGRKLSQ